MHVFASRVNSNLGQFEPEETVPADCLLKRLFQGAVCDRGSVTVFGVRRPAPATEIVGPRIHWPRERSAARVEELKAAEVPAALAFSAAARCGYTRSGF